MLGLAFITVLLLISGIFIHGLWKKKPLEDSKSIIQELKVEEKIVKNLNKAADMAKELNTIGEKK